MYIDFIIYVNVDKNQLKACIYYIEKEHRLLVTVFRL